MVLEVPIARLRQIMSAISRRVDARDRIHRTYVEWQTKAIASFVAAISPNPKGAKALLKQVKDLTMMPEPEQKPELWTPRENKPGTYEQIVGGLS